ncbi:hypothetical protein OO007_07425 [Cocleimonas sp. KMM 6892]|uniref:hypothetical protein n=1 Tax=unclassified Cocleimonas TaxID=2639732 RepID=UPI002DB89612|nr:MULTISPECIES: hypothetical protein [unclassified Cocleimonas]MEB8432054.1 hypothetical protein [Cocleimonas sp. KMM 6892]MEC4714860.1 hypothetical protein [Cocleimonas sp. KMM 6895]MEC4744326.1 hypothetical protein [Cocleimonas sp. KMM 6896]
MLEYLFFNREIAEKFTAFLDKKSLAWEEFIDPMLDSIVIKTSEDIADDLWDELDDYHEVLGEEDQKLLEVAMQDTDTETNAAGIYIQLAGGKQTVAQVNPDVMNRMLEVISMDEFNTFVETIVSSVENPDDSPICHT